MSSTFPVPGGATFLRARNNLSDLANAATALANLGGAPLADVANVIPADLGWLAWNYDPAYTAQGITLAASYLYVMRVNVRAAISVTNVIIAIATAGSSLTSSENYAGLYNSSGSLIAATADQTTAWESNGYKTMPLASGPYNLLAATFCWVAILANGTTPPKPAALTSVAGAPTSLAQRGVSAANSYFAYSTSGLTSLPSSFTPSSLSQVNGTPFAGLS